MILNDNKYLSLFLLNYRAVISLQHYIWDLALYTENRSETIPLLFPT
jgi:hypothetical protein